MSVVESGALAAALLGAAARSRAGHVRVETESIASAVGRGQGLAAT